MLTAKEISAKKFEKSKGFGGYRIDDVEDFMDRVAEYAAHIEAEKSDMEKKLAILAEKLEEYRADEDSLRTALLGAQKLGDGVIRESKTKAEIILRDATIKAEKIVNDAHSKVEDEERKLAQIKRDVSGFKKSMSELYKKHLEVLIDSIPEEIADTRPEQIDEPVVSDDPIDAEQTMEFSMEAEEGSDTVQRPIQEPVYQTIRAAHRSATASDDEGEEDTESKFGPLKFGERFNLTRNDDPGAKRRK